jgi:hypothetical protein
MITVYQPMLSPPPQKYQPYIDSVRRFAKSIDAEYIDNAVVPDTMSGVALEQVKDLLVMEMMSERSHVLCLDWDIEIIDNVGAKDISPLLPPPSDVFCITRDDPYCMIYNNNQTGIFKMIYEQMLSFKAEELRIRPFIFWKIWRNYLQSTNACDYVYFPDMSHIHHCYD